MILNKINNPKDIKVLSTKELNQLATEMIELIVKELSGHAYQPADSENNANDDLDRLASYIARNMKERRG